MQCCVWEREREKEHLFRQHVFPPWGRLTQQLAGVEGPTKDFSSCKLVLDSGWQPNNARVLTFIQRREPKMTCSIHLTSFAEHKQNVIRQNLHQVASSSLNNTWSLINTDYSRPLPCSQPVRPGQDKLAIQGRGSADFFFLFLNNIFKCAPSQQESGHKSLIER